VSERIGCSSKMSQRRLWQLQTASNNLRLLLAIGEFLNQKVTSITLCD
jgi:hypothetical protein